MKTGPDENAARIDEALRIASEHGLTDGAHHKQWVIDQMVRCLTGCPLVRDHEKDTPSLRLGESEEYQAFLNGEEWDEGTAP